MNKIKVFGVALAGVFLVAGIAAANDPVVIAPDNYSMKFKNDRVRVSEVTIKPGDSIPMHSHPEHFLYVLSPGTVQLTYPDGKTVDFTGTQGQVAWLPAESHSGKNTGTTEFRALVVELSEK